MRGPAEFLDECVRSGDLPSASWIVAGAEGVLDSGAVGSAALLPHRVAATTETIYDLASLTKPLVTSPLAIVLGRQAGIGFGDPAGRFLPEFTRLDKRDITLAQLLTHTSGLPDWAPLYLHGCSIREYLGQIRETALRTTPGARVLYSDLGYIALGAILEKVGGAPLDALCARFITGPAGSGALFRPAASLGPRVAPTEEACNYEREKAGAGAAGYQGWRRGLVHGEVHDQNAWAAGGVAGHAGLFGTAEDVHRIAREVISVEPSWLREEDLALITKAQSGPGPEPRSFAFRVNRGADGGVDATTAAGAALAASAIGHNGFTGTSIWLEPERRRVYVLLTNRVHPFVRADVDMNAIRRGFHETACRV
ncbi:MAG: beta-lactamase family protein [Acidobacteria bacterium]|nr:beta-lactamase family protein [Acidobacteriota bacterium]